MIIDFHTHVFPDKIASKTIAMLSEKASIPAFSDGSINGLLDRMKQAGVDLSVTLPVVTNPAQFDSINRFAAEINSNFADRSPRLISFAGIHPKCENIESKMSFIKKSGFLGVKLHPDYQGQYITHEGYVKILECAKEYDLIVVTHAGVDGGFPNMPVRCTPELALELIRKVPHAKFVLAHLGGNAMFDDVLDKLCGENVFFDTAYVLRFIGEQRFKQMISRHGADRILFASDSPWSSIENDVNIIRSFSLDKITEEKILYKNARGLLGI